MARHTIPATRPRQPARHTRNSCRQLLPTMLILALFTTTAVAVPLSAFMPSIDPSTLTPSCAAIYTSPIPTCTAADFSENGQCSSPCITSLVTLSTSIYNACGGDTRNDQLLVGQFLAGNGISILCKGVVVVTMSGQGAATSMLQSTTSTTSKTTILVSPSPSSLSVREPTSIPTPTPTPTLSSSSTHTPSSSSPSSAHNTHNTPATHTRPTSPPHTSSHHPPSTTQTQTQLPTDAAQAAQAQYSHCIEYEANPFKDCRRPAVTIEDQGQGNDGAPARATSLVVLYMTGVFVVCASLVVGLV